MLVDKTDLDAAVAQQIVTREQADQLQAFLASRPQRGRFTGLNVAYYLGALIVIGGMGWLMNRGWEQFGGWWLFAIATLYAALFVLASRSLDRMPAGLLVTMAVCMTPLAIYGLERTTGLWPATDPGEYRGFFPYIKSSWFFMEAATVIAGSIAVRLRRFPFMVAPIAVALWFMSMDLAALLFDVHYGQKMSDTAVVFGLSMLIAAFLVDHRSREDYAFWLYFFGMTALWSGISLQDSHSELGKLAYCALNLGFIVLSVLIRRRVFIVYGAIGVNVYLVHLASEVFKDSILFPFTLTLLGLSVIALAVQYQKRRARLDAWAESLVPSWLRARLPQARIAAGGG
jgi:hypothetical protein